MTEESDDITRLTNLMFRASVFPATLRLFWVTEKQFIYINEGHRSFKGHAYDIATTLNEDRGKILDIFAQFEHVIYELVRLKIQGHGHENTRLLLRLIDAAQTNRLLRMLRDNKIIDVELFKHLDNLFKTRNQLAHDFSIHEVEYNSQKLIHTLDHSNFENFKNEINEAWKKLVEVYSIEQEKIDLPTIIKQIEDVQPS